MPETETENAEHNRFVKALTEELKKQGFEISNAACEGCEPCTEVENMVPDVKAYNRKKEFVVFGLAKTCNELAEKLTEEQFKFFTHRFMHNGKLARVLVPFFHRDYQRL